MHDPKKGIYANIEACNEELAKKATKGMLELGLYNDRLALFYDPAKLPHHQVDNLAAAYVVKFGVPLLVIEKPGLYESSRSQVSSGPTLEA